MSHLDLCSGKEILKISSTLAEIFSKWEKNRTLIEITFITSIIFVDSTILKQSDIFKLCSEIVTEW